MSQSLQDKFRLWRNRIDASKKLMEDQAPDWEKYEKGYEGKILDKGSSDFTTHITPVNYLYVDVRSGTPKLYTQNPYIYIDPQTPEADLNAEVMEKVINSKLGDWKLQERMEELIKGTKLEGRTYLKVSYKFDKDKIGREFGGEEPNDEIAISFISREDLFIDRNSSSFKKSRWVAHKIQAPIGEIREKFKLKEDDKPAICEDRDIPKGVTDDEKPDFQYGTYWEIEDRIARTLAIIVDGIDRFAVKPYPFPYKFYTMYSALEWNDIPGCLNTKADPHFWWNQLVELSHINTQKINHSRKLNSKYIIQGPRQLDDEEVGNLTSYEDGIFCQLPTGFQLVPHQHATLGPEVYQAEQSLRQDITIISGMNEMKQGLPQTQKTAREAMAIVSESQDVMTYRAKKVELVVEEVIQKCISLIQQFYDTTRIVELTGMEESEFLGLKDKLQDRVLGKASKPFLSFVGKELVGKMRPRIKAGSAMPVDENQRKQDLMQLVGLMAQNQQLAASVDSKELIKEIAKLLHIENKGILLNPKSPEQENALLKRDIPVMPHLNENHPDHIQKHMLENNNTPAFLMHIFGHNVLQKFIGQSQIQGPVPQGGPQAGPGGLSQENMGGMPQGPSMPPGGMPPQQSPAVPQGPQPQPAGLPAGLPV